MKYEYFFIDNYYLFSQTYKHSMCKILKQILIYAKKHCWIAIANESDHSY